MLIYAHWRSGLEPAPLPHLGEVNIHTYSLRMGKGLVSYYLCSTLKMQILTVIRNGFQEGIESNSSKDYTALRVEGKRSISLLIFDPCAILLFLHLIQIPSSSNSGKFKKAILETLPVYIYLWNQFLSKVQCCQSQTSQASPKRSSHPFFHLPRQSPLLVPTEAFLSCYKKLLAFEKSFT